MEQVAEKQLAHARIYSVGHIPPEAFREYARDGTLECGLILQFDSPDALKQALADEQITFGWRKSTSTPVVATQQPLIGEPETDTYHLSPDTGGKR